MAYFRGLKTFLIYALALLALYFVSLPTWAQGGGIFATQQEAQTACALDEAAQIAAGSSFPGPYPNVACALFVSTGYAPYAGQYRSQSLPTNAAFNFWFYATTCLDGSAFVVGTACPAVETAATCAAKPDSLTNIQHSDGSLICMGGCKYESTNAGDGGSVLISPFITGGTGSTCTVASNAFACPTGYTALASAFNPNNYLGQECIPNTDDADGDGLANNVDPTPFEAGAETKDTDGDGIPDSSDSMPNDATNGKGTTASKADNTSEGGGNCTSPPVSQGDAIAAQIAYQTWATRCAVDRLSTLTAAATGGSSSVDFTATNGKIDATNTKLDAANTKADAANSKLDGIQSNTAAGAAKLAQIADGAAADMSVGDLEAVPGAVASGSDSGDQEFGAEGLDETGYGAGSTCPVPQSFDVMGQTFTPDISIFCDFMEITGLLVLALGAFASVRIMGSA